MTLTSYHTFIIFVYFNHTWSNFFILNIFCIKLWNVKLYLSFIIILQISVLFMVQYIITLCFWLDILNQFCAIDFFQYI